MRSSKLRLVVAVCAIIVAASSAAIAFSTVTEDGDGTSTTITTTTIEGNDESDLAIAECKANAAEAGAALIEAASTKAIPERPEDSDNYLKYTREGQVLFAEREADRLMEACEN